MAFNINAQVILRASKSSIKAVKTQIKSQLTSISVPINLTVSKTANAKLASLNKQLIPLNANLAKTSSRAKDSASSINSLSSAANKLNATNNKFNKTTQRVNRGLRTSSKEILTLRQEVRAFGKDSALAIRRFAAFTLATTAVFGFVRAVQRGISEAIKFQRELVKIVQVTGASATKIDSLTGSIDRLSVSLGVDAKELLTVARTFAQTGQSLDQVEKSLKAVARASLTPTFGSMESITEGLIAAMAQFNIEAGRSEAVLGSLNAVSKKFAVESGDLISSIRRAGGVFSASTKQLGGPEERLRELISLFTAVRSTTRESADNIAVGLRTIFTRIQRPTTIKFLEQFGIQLRATADDAKRLNIAKGEFVGFFEAFGKLSGKIDSFDTLTLAKVVEELGGIRQVGKLIPLLRNFTKAEEARQVALAGTESISKDVALATQSLSVQIESVRQKFNLFIRDVVKSTIFQNLSRVVLTFAESFISLADALRPAIPLLTALAAIKLGSIALDFGIGFGGGLKKGGGVRGVGAGLSGLITGQPGTGARSLATADSTGLSKNAIVSNTQAVQRNSTALSLLNTTIGKLQTVALSLVRASRTVSTKTTSLIVALNKLPLEIAAAVRGATSTSAATALQFGKAGRKARGGPIQKFAGGGFVNGPSHARGGIVAELEGGEFIVPKNKLNNVSISSGELVVPPKEAKANLGMLQRANQGFFVGNLLDRLPNSTIAAGPGTGTSDSIKTRLPEGSFVVNAKDTGRLRDKAQFAGGGSVGLASRKRTPFVGGGVVGKLGGLGTIIPLLAQIAFLLPLISNLDFSNFGGLINGLAIAAIPLLFLAKSASKAGIAQSALAANTKKTAEIVKLQFADGRKEHALRQQSSRRAKLDARRASIVRKNVSNFEKNKGSNLPGRLRFADKEFSKELRQKREIQRARQIASSNQRKNLSLDLGQPETRNRGQVSSALRARLEARRLQAGRTLLGGQRSINVTRGLSTGTKLGRFSGVSAGVGAALGNLTPILAKIGKGLSSGPAGIFAIVAALVSAPIVDAITTGFVGARETIQGVKGFSKDQGGQRIAQLTGGVKGALQGGFSGAALGGLVGSIFGPIGTAIGAGIGAITGAVIGGIAGTFSAFKKQIQFEEIKKLDNASSAASDSLDKLAGQGIRNVEILQQVTATNKDLLNQISISSKAFADLETSAGQRFFGDNELGRDLDDLKTFFGIVDTGATAFEKFNIAIDTLTVGVSLFRKTFIGDDNIKGLKDSKILAGTSTILQGGSPFDALNRLLGNRDESSNARFVRAASTQELGVQFQASLKSLNSISDETFDKASKEFERLNDAIIDSIPLDNLTELANLSKDASFDDLTIALDNAGDQSEEFKAQLEAFKTLKSLKIASDIKKISVELDNLGKTDKTKLGLTNIAGASLAEFSESFKTGGNFQQAGVDAGELFIKGLNRQQNLKGIKTGFNVNQIAGDFTSLQKIVTSAGKGSVFAKQQIQVLASNLQNIDASDLSKIVNRIGAVISGPDADAAISKATASQKLLDDLFRSTASGIDALASALKRLTGGLASAVSDFTTILGNVESEVTRLFSTEQTLKSNQRVNVFAGGGVGRTTSELQAGVEQVRRGVGGDPEFFKDLSSTIQFSNELPQTLKDTIDNLKRSGGDIGFVDFEAAIIDKLSTFDNLPKVFQNQFKQNLEALFTGGREGGTKLGAVGIETALETKGSGINSLQEAGTIAAQALEESVNQLNAFNSALLSSANLQLKSTRQLLDAEIQILKKREAAQDKFSKFEARTSDVLSRSRERLAKELNTLLGAGGIPLGPGGAGATSLLDRRSSLEGQRRSLLDSIGDVIGVRTTDPTRAARELSLLDTTEAKAFLDKLTSVVSALEGTNKAIDLLANDTRELSAIESKLSSINEQRLSGRQRGALLLGQLAGAKGPGDIAKIIADAQRPLAAFLKVQAGQEINFREGDALAKGLAGGIGGEIANLLRQRQPGITDEQILNKLEQGRAGLQQGLLNKAPNLFGPGFGFDKVAANAILGGPAVGVAGKGRQEKGLLGLKDKILKDQEELILGLAKQNAKSIADQQVIVRDQFDATTGKINDTATAFENLRKKMSALVDVVNKRAGQLGIAVGGDGGGFQDVGPARVVKKRRARGFVPGQQTFGSASAASEFRAKQSQIDRDLSDLPAFTGQAKKKGSILSTLGFLGKAVIARGRQETQRRKADQPILDAEVLTPGQQAKRAKDQAFQAAKARRNAAIQAEKARRSAPARAKVALREEAKSAQDFQKLQQLTRLKQTGRLQERGPRGAVRLENLENKIALGKGAASQALFASVRQRGAQEQLAFADRFEGEERQNIARRILGQEGQNKVLKDEDRKKLERIANPNQGLPNIGPAPVRKLKGVNVPAGGAAAGGDPLGQVINVFNNSPFAADLLKASQTLATLPQLTIQLDARVGPVEVILNGADLMAQFEGKIMDNILAQIGTRFNELRTNADGSQRDPSISTV